MPISTRDRKLLWARSGGTCALCKSHLTADAKGDDRDVVLGEEAHIVSEEANGPRYRPMSITEVDVYANLILLCPADHKIVDEQVAYYTEQRLQALKHEHEQWVKDKVSPTIPRSKIRDPEVDKPVRFQLIDSGKALLGIVTHTHGAYLDNPEPRSAEEAELIGGFLQDVTDYMEVWHDIGPSRQIQAEFSMSETIRCLREAGLAVYAGIKKHVIEGGSTPPSPWPMAYVVVRRDDGEAVKASSTNE